MVSSRAQSLLSPPQASLASSWWLKQSCKDAPKPPDCGVEKERDSYLFMELHSDSQKWPNTQRPSVVGTLESYSLNLTIQWNASSLLNNSKKLNN
jgi:hypothetical protein